MPLRFDVEEYLGTNADHSRSDEYCYYCLKDGQYTVDIPMDEMVDIWVKYTGKYNGYSGTDYTPQELRMLLNKRLPTLKRWRQKQETEYAHYEAVNRIRTYIDRNLFSGLDPENLAVMANLSFYHFRKVFRSVTGENVGAYIQRLRLEYVAHLLIATNQSIHDIQGQTNYQTNFSLAKAFRKHFGISMSAYRKKYFLAENQPLPDNLPKAEIRRISSRQAVCLEVKGAFRSKETYDAIWKQAIHYKEEHLKETNDNYVSISLDNPLVTPVEQRRLYIGIMTGEAVKPEGRFSVMEIPGGIYAVFRHRGSYSLLPGLYKAIYEQWFPQYKYIQKNSLTFEVYLNTPDEAEAGELMTDIYIPIEKH